MGNNKFGFNMRTELAARFDSQYICTDFAEEMFTKGDYFSKDNLKQKTKAEMFSQFCEDYADAIANMQQRIYHLANALDIERTTLFAEVMINRELRSKFASMTVEEWLEMKKIQDGNDILKKLNIPYAVVKEIEKKTPNDYSMEK